VSAKVTRLDPVYRGWLSETPWDSVLPMSLAPAVDAHEETNNGLPPGFATVTDDAALASKKYRSTNAGEVRRMLRAANMLSGEVLNCGSAPRSAVCDEGNQVVTTCGGGNDWRGVVRPFDVCESRSVATCAGQHF